MLEPLGQSQVLPYVFRIAEAGTSFWLLSFEKPADLERVDARGALQQALAARRIRWVPLRYHKSPSVPATASDMFRGVLVALWLCARYRIGIVHVRSYVPAVIGSVVKIFIRTKLIFDMRGFWPEERVDGGLWPAGGSLYRAAKRCEGWLLRQSDAIVVLTNRAKALLLAAPYRPHIGSNVPIVVIPCCTDVKRFEAPKPSDGDWSGQLKTIVYAGSVGTWYMLEEMLDFFVAAREVEPDLHLLILNRNDHGAIAARLNEKSLTSNAVTVTAAAASDMPRHLASAFGGLYFIRPCYSKLASSPTKLAEYLAARLPVIVNMDIGDSSDMIAEERLGVVIRSFDKQEYRRKWDEFQRLLEADPAIGSRCRAVAEASLSLEYGAAQYLSVYETLQAS